MAKQSFIITLNDKSLSSLALKRHIRTALELWSAHKVDNPLGIGTRCVVMNNRYQWQPIKDCPKVRNQSYIVFCEASRCVYVAYWNGEIWAHFDTGPERELPYLPTLFKPTDLPRKRAY